MFDQQHNILRGCQSGNRFNSRIEESSSFLYAFLVGHFYACTEK